MVFRFFDRGPFVWCALSRASCSDKGAALYPALAVGFSGLLAVASGSVRLDTGCRCPPRCFVRRDASRHYLGCRRPMHGKTMPAYPGGYFFVRARRLGRPWPSGRRFGSVRCCCGVQSAAGFSAALAVDPSGAGSAAENQKLRKSWLLGMATTKLGGLRREGRVDQDGSEVGGRYWCRPPLEIFLGASAASAGLCRSLLALLPALPSALVVAAPLCSRKLVGYRLRGALSVPFGCSSSGSLLSPRAGFL